MQNIPRQALVCGKSSSIQQERENYLFSLFSGLFAVMKTTDHQNMSAWSLVPSPHLPTGQARRVPAQELPLP
jgi:hypothetical protein